MSYKQKHSSVIRAKKTITIITDNLWGEKKRYWLKEGQESQDQPGKQKRQSQKQNPLESFLW